MPKPTFFNLPAEKKQSLIEAVKEEFSRTSLAEACISNIVQRASIPRGSFYQYFEDKEDAYFYILSEFTEQLNETFFERLKKREGDLFLAMTDFFQYVITDQANADLLKQAFLNLNHKIQSTFTSTFIDDTSRFKTAQLLQMVDKDKLNGTTEKQMIHILKILIAVTFRNFIEKFAHNLSDEEAIENYILELSLLKNGLANEKGKTPLKV